MFFRRRAGEYVASPLHVDFEVYHSRQGPGFMDRIAGKTGYWPGWLHN
jgi:hypothetical protein